MRKSYVGPVILVTDDEKAPTKFRKVEVYKNNVYKDIDLLTHKHVDAHADMPLQAGNAVSSDTTEDVDIAVIAGYVEFRDATLRDRLQFALVDQPSDYANDDITLEDNMYRYWIEVSEEFKDLLLRPLATYIRRYLVYGALYDWYAQFGMLQQASVYGPQADRLEEMINSLLRGPSIVQRPMQPFGPAQLP